MKVYKLNIDPSKPTRQTVAMQANSTGALSVEAAIDGWPIRNLSCSLKDSDGTEISSFAESEKGAAFTLPVTGDKIVTVGARATPTECSAQYILSSQSGTRVFSVPLNVAQLEEGSYRQDEFRPIAAQYGAMSTASTVVAISPSPDTLSNCNFDVMWLMPPSAPTPVVFKSNGRTLGEDELIQATGPVTLRRSQAVKTKSNGSWTLSSYNYPAIGYNVDYSMPTTIRASDDAPCYAEVPAPVKDFAVESLSADVIVPGAIAGGESVMVPKWVTVTIGDAEYTLLSGVAPE